MTDHTALVKELNAVVPYQGKSAVAFLCHEAAATITALQAEVAALREALEPLARLEPPSKPQGNAGFYSIYHKHIIAARAARGGQA